MHRSLKGEQSAKEQDAAAHRAEAYVLAISMPVLETICNQDELSSKSKAFPPLGKVTAA